RAEQPLVPLGQGGVGERGGPLGVAHGDTVDTTVRNRRGLVSARAYGRRMSELLDQHRHVLTRSVEVVAQMRPGQLDVATPCAGWALSDLLAHMIGQHYGFAAAATAVPDVGEFAPRAIGADAVAEYTASVESVLAAFAS